eukprot:scaffold17701_cov38-Cyclotella_meneghiniana.AAC.4
MQSDGHTRYQQPAHRSCSDRGVKYTIGTPIKWVQASGCLYENNNLSPITTIIRKMYMLKD